MYCVCIVSSGNQYPFLFFLMFDFWDWTMTRIARICSFICRQFIFLCFSVNVETGKCNAKCHFWSLRQCMRKHQVCACVCACMEIFYFFPCFFFTLLWAFVARSATVVMCLEICVVQVKKKIYTLYVNVSVRNALFRSKPSWSTQV